MRYLVFFLAIFTYMLTFAQSAPITIDGVYNDWTTDLITFTDTPESVSGIDLLEMQISNDDNFLFIKIKTDTEFDLTTDLISQGLMLYIDTDNNPNTGYNIQNGYGSELGVDFKDRMAHFNVNPYSQLSFSDIQMRPAPTVTSNEFEIAIGRNVIPDGINPLFTSSTIRILFKDVISGDSMPNNNTIFYYTFDEAPVTSFVPTDINKEDPNFIRIVAYNTLFNGLEDPNRLDNFENIISILNPDIIGFSECGDTNIVYVKALLDNWIPLGTSNGWYVINDYTGDLITASRWEIIQDWELALYRQFPVLINLPENYNTDLLFTNSHLRCCSANYERQEQVDEYVAFMLDAKSQGGEISLDLNTPFVYAGDLNLVGYAQQLTTLITGDIQNTTTYGLGAPYDWDETDVTDQICRQTDKRMAYTWRDDSSSFPPGRLDYMIFSDAVMVAEKSFTLQTEVMPTDRLQTYGFDQYDTSDASDHFPIVTDFSLNAAIGVSEIEHKNSMVYPNPAKEIISVIYKESDAYKVLLYDAYGVLIYFEENIFNTTNINLRSIYSGVYFVSIIDEKGNKEWYKILKE